MSTGARNKGLPGDQWGELLKVRLPRAYLKNPEDPGKIHPSIFFRRSNSFFFTTSYSNNNNNNNNNNN